MGFQYLASIDSANNGWSHAPIVVWPSFKNLTEFIFSNILCACTFNGWTLSLNKGEIVLRPGGSVGFLLQLAWYLDHPGTISFVSSYAAMTMQSHWISSVRASSTNLSSLSLLLSLSMFTLIEQRGAHSSLLVLLFSANNFLTLIYSWGSGYNLLDFKDTSCNISTCGKSRLVLSLVTKLYDRNTGSMVMGADKVWCGINVKAVFQRSSKYTFL